MQHRWAVITGVLLLSRTLGACATIIEGSDQTVTVITEPPGAVCTFTRGNATVGVANPTPASVHLEKSKDNISILCQKDGYFDVRSRVCQRIGGHDPRQYHFWRDHRRRCRCRVRRHA